MQPSLSFRLAPQHAGAASGVLTTAIQIGNAVAVAVVGVILYRTSSAISASLGIVDAFQRGVIIIMAVGLAVAVLVQFLPFKAPTGPSTGP